MCLNTSNKKLRHVHCPDWASLHGSLVYLLLDKLLEAIDHVRFAAVCKGAQFRKIIMKQSSAGVNTKQRLLPMLLISSAESEEETLKLYSIAERKVYSSIKLPLPCRKSSRRCFGSNHDSGGWFTRVDVVEDELPYLDITLVNPFRKEVLHLPRLLIDFLQFNSIPLKGLKVILSGDPTLNPDSFVVIAINGRDNVSSIKGLDSDWVCWDFAYDSTDAIVYENQVYSVTAHGRLNLLDVDKVITNRFRPQTRDGPSADKVYLVESTQGDLLLVQRYKKPRKNDGSHDQKLWTNSFVVHKVGFKKRDVKLDRGIIKLYNAPLYFGDKDRSKEFELIEVESIGDEVLFVGDNFSFSVLASDYPGCQSNSIYYTDDDSTQELVGDAVPYEWGSST